MLRHWTRIGLGRYRPYHSLFTRRLISTTPFNAKKVTLGSATDVFAEQLKQVPIALEPKMTASGSMVLDTVREQTKLYPHCVLLIQVGDFYELYESHAANYAAKLDIKLTRKDMASGVTVDFAGFPLRSLDRYLDILVNRLGCRVALCEQAGTVTREDGSVMGKRRRMTRIITPGTVIEERFLDASSNSYLMAVSTNGDDVGLAWIDLSVGEFVLQYSKLDAFKDDLARIRPREVILPLSMKPKQDPVEDIEDPIARALINEPYIAISYQKDTDFDAAGGREALNTILMADSTTSSLGEEALESLDTLDSLESTELSSAMAIISYINGTHIEDKPQLQRPVRYNAKDNLRIDSAAIVSLELVKGLKDGRKADSLVGVIDSTVTSAGSRLLARWLTSPLTSIERINQRLNAVEFFYDRPELLSSVREIFKQSTDAQRALQRIAVRRGQRSDLLDICNTLDVIKKFKAEVIPYLDQKPLTLNAMSIYNIAHLLDPHEKLTQYVKKAIGHQILDKDKDKPYGIVNRSFKPALERLHSQLDQMEIERDGFHYNLRLQCGNSVSLTSSGLYKHVVEINGTQASKLLAIYDCHLVNKTKTKHRYQVDTWTNLSVEIETKRSQLIEMEARIIEEIVEKVMGHSLTILHSCRVMAQLDVFASFAQLSNEQRYVRPKLVTDNQISITGGRHPVVESHLARKGRSFVQNDLKLGDQQEVWLLTGPNMGGKSTFLRQNAVIVLLAHMGCFVPARKATIGITDRIFSRVGAADNLAQDQSTFMVEMAETATILQQATERSMVIMDEVGRGTSTTDGFSLAYAILYDLSSRIQCRTLFATHYHELADALDDDRHPELNRIKCFMTSLHEDENGFTFLHRVRPGVCRQSHGLKVAQLAGLPPSVVAMAQDVWTQLNQEGKTSVFYGGEEKKMNA
ncbi:DNA mismatch repair protein MutS [Spinellus fusiger]|nr:DNA mismatch repair protein MutS [Spinellus fusiger]